MANIFTNRRRFEAAQRLGRIGQWPFVSEGWVKHLPGMLGNWTSVRDLRPLPEQSFRNWWRKRKGSASSEPSPVSRKLSS
jgi:L-lactate dehydrogenase complex protein LldF